mmetsp:Transcript_26378/g.73725  ORF Transcript_26378/g.73725 Transcript_26378/m.73725 type:complete len:259 (-) Transcript_26378:144-920(-)|eukprot:CAMPEP_0119133318 /NCGR_PEP_ID=MMETSP1310-20130426/13313_1 /TAXON_ID=464262 /ORGANISM="Genus nov. species nov., Strain RCC2339" /LENGTH=258 /DNA_ID=CAMNT_0007124005 /DNA_START=65 /DNA_END=841 /DNA_ORIENTATION=+
MSGTTANRRLFVGGNWKCNLGVESATNLAKDLSQLDTNGVDVVVAPTFLHLLSAKVALGDSKIEVATQNVGSHKSGAFTGSHSPAMIKEADIPWVIIGHSERRSIFGEDDDLVQSKVAAALEAGLRVIACVGESLEQRNAGQTLDVVLNQVKAVAKGVSNWYNVVIAYEPVWAIGTGKVASPSDAQDVHYNIRKWLAENVSADVAASTRIIYGGSVKPGNAKELGQQPDIDGFLVGGASLKAADFGAIIHNAKASGKL